MTYNPEYARDWSQRNRDRISERRRTYYAEHPDKKREHQRRDNQRLMRRLVERRTSLVAAQNGLCPCGEPLVDVGNYTVLDHDHRCCDVRPRDSCGKCDRAAMHMQCNSVIDMVGLSPERLRRLADYVESFGGTP
jgi:hypothetical protein